MESIVEPASRSGSVDTTISETSQSNSRNSPVLYSCKIISICLYLIMVENAPSWNQISGVSIRQIGRLFRRAPQRLLWQLAGFGTCALTCFDEISLRKDNFLAAHRHTALHITRACVDARRLANLLQGCMMKPIHIIMVCVLTFTSITCKPKILFCRFV